MHIVVGIVYISHLSQEKKRRYGHSCRCCLHFTFITREERRIYVHILVGTVYISHLSQEKREDKFF